MRRRRAPRVVVTGVQYMQVGVSSDLGWLVTDGRIWDLSHEGTSHALPSDLTPGGARLMTPDGNLAVAMTPDHSLQIWRLPAEEPGGNL